MNNLDDYLKNFNPDERRGEVVPLRAAAAPVIARLATRCAVSNAHARAVCDLLKIGEDAA